MKAILVIDHGSLVEAANHMLETVVMRMQEKRPDLIVEMAHMELAKPSIEDGISACVERGATHIVAHPYMLSPGRHATKDIPRMVEAVAQRYPQVSIQTSPPLGVHDKVIEVALERAGV